MTTPFDHFVKSVTTWLDSAWYVWVALVFALIVVVLVVVLSKVRARSRRRIPQYRRQISGR